MATSATWKIWMNFSRSRPPPEKSRFPSSAGRSRTACTASLWEQRSSPVNMRWRKWCRVARRACISGILAWTRIPRPPRATSRSKHSKVNRPKQRNTPKSRSWRLLDYGRLRLQQFGEQSGERRDVKRLLHHGSALLREMRQRSGIQQRAAHENEFGSRSSRARLNPFEEFLAVHARQIEIAKHEIVTVRGEMRQRLFRTGCAFHGHAPRRKPFLDDFADAFLVVHHVHRMSPQCSRSRGSGDRRPHRERWRADFFHELRQPHAKFRALARAGLHLDAAAVLLDDGRANRQTQAGAAARTLGGEKGIENFSDVFRSDAGTIVREYETDLAISALDGNSQDAAFALAGDGLLRVHDQIHENLVQELGVGFQRQAARRRAQFNRNILLRERSALLVNRCLQSLFRPHFLARQR